MKTTKIISLLLGLALSTNAAASEAFEELGDLGQYLMSGVALLAIASEQDWNGLPMYGESLAASVGTTYLLKKTVKEPRPRDPTSTDSFPSGHATWAFASAGFVHLRYGLMAGLPAYTLASLVAYSRVDVGAHRNRDVIAGAAIGVGANLIFTKRFVQQDVDMQASSFASPESTGFRVRATW